MSATDLARCVVATELLDAVRYFLTDIDGVAVESEAADGVPGATVLMLSGTPYPGRTVNPAWRKSSSGEVELLGWYPTVEDV